MNGFALLVGPFFNAPAASDDKLYCPYFIGMAKDEVLISDVE